MGDTSMAAGSGFCAEEKGLWKVLFRGEGGGGFWEDGQQRVKGDTLHSRLRSVFHTGKGWRCCYGFAAAEKKNADAKRLPDNRKVLHLQAKNQKYTRTKVRSVT